MDEKTLKIAAYMRLSREDGDSGESDSITNQRAIIRDYAQSHGDTIAKEYVDDGHTGTNFNRPAFQELLQDIKENKINCIIVKDLSRFGRNLTECGRYLEQLFPVWGVRFISIFDMYDTSKNNSAADTLTIAFKSLINEMYCHDMSVKIKATLDMKRRNGEFIGNMPPYGYLKDPDNKNKLIVDERSANIIRMIFDLKIEGMNSTRIAEYLDSIGVPSPAQRLLEMGYKCGIFPDECHWTHQAVARILSDETYIGTMVQGKRKKVSFKKEKMVDVSRENWIRAEGAVTPIISKRDFEFVQDLGQRDTSTAKDRTHVHLFAGFARCGDCGQNMMHFPVTQHGNTYCFYACSENRQNKTCSSHRIREDKLMRSVAAAMREQIEYLLLVADKLKERQDVPANRLALTSIDEKIKETLDEIAKCQKAKNTIYEDKIAGLLDRESFVMMTELYTNRQKKAEDTMEALQLEKQKLIEDRYHLIPWIESLREFRGFTQLTRRMLVTMVQDIFVYEGGKVEVIFKYSDQIADILRMVLEEGEEITVPKTREIVIEDMPAEEPMKIPTPSVPELVLLWEPDFVDAKGVEVGCIPSGVEKEMAVV